jgi:excinuclease UvrABC helicase subunit UvrB
LEQNISLKEVFDYLKTLQYERGSFNEIKAGTYVVDKSLNKIYIFNPDGSFMLEITWQKKLIEKIKRFKIKKSKEDVFKLEITGDYEDLDEVKIFPAKFFVTPKEKLDLAILNIKQELKEQYWKFLKEGKIVEAERIRQRTLLDISLLEKYGYCPGIENYSRHLIISSTRRSSLYFIRLFTSGDNFIY